MDDIILGSGHVYILEQNNTNKLTGNMTNAQLREYIGTYAVSGNLAGHVKNGATLNYTATKYTEKDDFSEITKTITTDESLNLAFGFIDYKTGLMDELVDNAETTVGVSDEAIKVGGLGNDKGKKYIVIFAHEDAADTDTYVILTGTNTANLAAAFATGAGTMFNAQFEAEPIDGTGRKAYIYRCAHGYVNPVYVAKITIGSTEYNNGSYYTWDEWLEDETKNTDGFVAHGNNVEDAEGNAVLLGTVTVAPGDAITADTYTVAE